MNTHLIDWTRDPIENVPLPVPVGIIKDVIQRLYLAATILDERTDALVNGTRAITTEDLINEDMKAGDHLLEAAKLLSKAMEVDNGQKD